MIFSNIVLVIFLVQFVHVAFSCNGYGIKVSKVRNGRTNSARLDEKIAVELTDDCTVKLDACIDISRTFKCAQINFEVKKPYIPFPLYSEKGTDICSALKELNCPLPCPVQEPGRYCAPENEIVLEDWVVKLLPTAEGDITITNAQVYYDGDNDKADSDFFDLVITIFKKPK